MPFWPENATMSTPSHNSIAVILPGQGRAGKGRAGCFNVEVKHNLQKVTFRYFIKNKKGESRKGANCLKRQACSYPEVVILHETSKDLEEKPDTQQRHLEMKQSKQILLKFHISLMVWEAAWFCKLVSRLKRKQRESQLSTHPYRT